MNSGLHLAHAGVSIIRGRMWQTPPRPGSSTEPRSHATRHLSNVLPSDTTFRVARPLQRSNSTFSSLPSWPPKHCPRARTPQPPSPPPEKHHPLASCPSHLPGTFHRSSITARGLLRLAGSVSGHSSGPELRQAPAGTLPRRHLPHLPGDGYLGYFRFPAINR